MAQEIDRYGVLHHRSGDTKSHLVSILMNLHPTEIDRLIARQSARAKLLEKLATFSLSTHPEGTRISRRLEFLLRPEAEALLEDPQYEETFLQVLSSFGSPEDAPQILDELLATRQESSPLLIKHGILPAGRISW